MCVVMDTHLNFTFIQALHTFLTAAQSYFKLQSLPQHYESVFFLNGLPTVQCTPINSLMHTYMQ